MRPIKTLSGVMIVIFLPIAGLLGFMIRQGLVAQKDANSLLDICTHLVLGSATRQQVVISSSPFNKYLSQRTEPSGPLTFFVSGPRLTHTVMAISFVFEHDRLVGREVVFQKEFCCSVSIRQALYVGNKNYGESGVAQGMIGDPRYLRFNLDPNLGPESIGRVYSFDTKCLTFFSQCSNTQALNPYTAKMLIAANGDNP